MTSELLSEPKPQICEFESMNLRVGGRIQFVTHRSIKEIQHFSTLIGYVKDEYLILKTPVENAVPVALNDGEKLTIRVFSGVTVCSFACTVLRVFPRPLNYVHVTFPDSIQGVSLRAAMRVKVDIPAQIVIPGLGPVPVLLVNLSVSGARVESAKRLSQDHSPVNLSFTVTAQPGNYAVCVNTRVTIQNVNVIKDVAGLQAEVFTYGVQFLDLEPAHCTILQNLTYEALITNRQRIV